MKLLYFCVSFKFCLFVFIFVSKRYRKLIQYNLYLCFILSKHHCNMQQKLYWIYYHIFDINILCILQIICAYYKWYVYDKCYINMQDHYIFNIYNYIIWVLQMYYNEWYRSKRGYFTFKILFWFIIYLFYGYVCMPECMFMHTRSCEGNMIQILYLDYKIYIYL